MQGMRSTSMPRNMGSSHRGAEATKPPPVQHDLNVSLEDLYTGTTKRMRITAKRFDPSSGRVVPVSTDKEIQVKAGWKDGTKITFEKEGDALSPGAIPADVVFTIKAKPHDRFTREGDNLLHECRITLHEALCGVRKTVQALDGRQLRIEAPFVTPDTVKILPGEGMPNSKHGNKGDMRVRFHIVFPDMSDAERAQIGNIIKNARYSSPSSSGAAKQARK